MNAKLIDLFLYIRKVTRSDCNCLIYPTLSRLRKKDKERNERNIEHLKAITQDEISKILKSRNPQDGQ